MNRKQYCFESTLHANEGSPPENDVSRSMVPGLGLVVRRALAVIPGGLGLRSLADEVIADPRVHVQGSGHERTGPRHDPVRVGDRGRRQARREHDNVPTDQIVSIATTASPPSMVLAETNEAGGQVAKAADLYKKAAGEACGKPLIEQAAQYKQAEPPPTSRWPTRARRPRPSHCSRPS